MDLAAIIVAVLTAAFTIYRERRANRWKGDHDRSMRELEHELRLAEGNRTKLRELQEPKRQTLADDIATWGHALAERVEDAQAAVQLGDLRGLSELSETVFQAVEHLGANMNAGGYLVDCADDRKAMREMEKHADSILRSVEALIKQHQQLGSLDPNLQHYLAQSVASDAKAITLLRDRLDDICRRLAGVEMVQGPRVDASSANMRKQLSNMKRPALSEGR